MNILDRNFNINQDLLLEASAGTGKTFSIENLVVRLLLENPSLNISKILIVTFTRAATSELRQRVQRCISKSVSHLQTLSNDAPDYLLPYYDDPKKALRILQKALLMFDEAQIYTIHGFCQSTLAEFSFEVDVCNSDEEMVSSETIRKLIRDYLSSELSKDDISSYQIELLLKYFSQDVEKLISRIESYVQQNVSVTSESFSFSHQIENAVNVLSTKYGSEAILNGFSDVASSFKEIHDRQGNLKQDVFDQVKSFALHFDELKFSPSQIDSLITSGGYFSKILHENKLKKNVTLPNFPFYEECKTSLFPYIEAFESVSNLFAYLVSNCKRIVDHYLEQEEKFRFDDLLSSMNRALDNPTIISGIRSKYSFAIIDEFQDTDPVQWNIIKNVFLDHSRIYLVGDPKQAIYAFRQADIYTYLDAAQTLGENAKVTLDTNYRSQSDLVEGLNFLFSKEHVPELISLPKIKSSLPFSSVKPSNRIEPKAFHDDKTSVHFCVVEADQGRSSAWPTDDVNETYLFPFIVEEILRLKVPFGDWAVLVKDRFQADAFAQYCKRWNIPTLMQRQGSLIETEAFDHLHALIRAFLTPHDTSAMKIALCNRLFGLTVHQIANLEPSIQFRFQYLRTVFLQNDFAVFFHTMMATHSTAESLLMQEGGNEYFQNLSQLAEILTEYQSQFDSSPDSLLQYMNELKQSDQEVPIRQDLSADAVKIMTIHVSKGLEFPIVYALGLAKRSPKPRGKERELLIPVEKEGQKILIPVNDQYRKEYEEWCEELDAEKMRQLYVAMTRAKHRLYIPIAFPVASKLLEPSEPSPIDLYLSKLKCANSKEEVIDFLKSGGFSHTDLNHHTFQLSKYVEEVREDLIPPSRVHVPGKDEFVRSFSSIVKHADVVYPDETPPRDPRCLVKSSHTLPAGKDTGIILHEILEGVHFSRLEDLRTVTEARIGGTPLADWGEPITDMLSHVLTTPLPTGFSLSDVPESQCYKEMEFTFKHDDFSLPFDLEGFEISADYIKGVIDLFFEYEGKYYILDWKSNWLGPNQDYYSLNYLDQAMKDHHYYLQAAIYREAVKRYLALMDPRPFDSCYGGAFYLFLRGINSTLPNNGVCYFDKNKNG